MIPFLAFQPEVRKVLYTTNMIDSINYQIRKIGKTRRHFPNDDALVKLLYLGTRDMGRAGATSSSAKVHGSGRASYAWKTALHQFDSCCLVPGLMEALNPREDEGHGSTEGVPGRTPGAGD